MSLDGLLNLGRGIVLFEVWRCIMHENGLGLGWSRSGGSGGLQGQPRIDTCLDSAS